MAKPKILSREAMSKLVAQMTEEHREDFEERAAILEFDAGMLRYDAERMALSEVMQ